MNWLLGKKELWVQTDFDQIPIFVKEGAIIPKYPVQQYVGELEFEEITLDVYFKLGKEKSIFTKMHKTDMIIIKVDIVFLLLI